MICNACTENEYERHQRRDSGFSLAGSRTVVVVIGQLVQESALSIDHLRLRCTAIVTSAEGKEVMFLVRYVCLSIRRITEQEAQLLLGDRATR